ncbi:hypothetical protein [Microcoleus phage My-WqHQDG]|nr:hypothetical protein [Microcoleus phage My-WqHQDG]
MLWIPQAINHYPWAPHLAGKYAVEVDEPTSILIGPRLYTTSRSYTWLELFWCPRERHAVTAKCKVLLLGIIYTQYGAWLTSRTHEEFVDTWALLLAFLDDCGAREYGLNGTYLIEY